MSHLPTFYKVRCWNHSTDKVEVIGVTIEDIVFKADYMHMNMVDVALILLNVERERNGLPLLNSTYIGGNEAHDVYKAGT